jgi:hypothetical protein
VSGCPALAGSGREHFAEFLSSYWVACLAPEWTSLDARLQNDITRRGRALSRGLPAMLAELSPNMQLDPASTDVLIRRPGSRGDAGEIDLALTDRHQILLVPSHFAWPELIEVMQKDLHNNGPS